jgi:large subunit ribosomal protein L25
MSNEIILNADLRIRTGTNKTREIRREDSMVPAIIYGNEEESKNIKLKLNELTKASENELFYTQVLKISLEGNEEKVVLKELQREPVKGKFLHADFQRVSRKTKLKVVVPFRFNGERNVRVLKRVAESLPKQFQK